MIYYSTEKGVFNPEKILIESLTANRRSGYNILITYFAPKLLDILE